MGEEICEKLLKKILFIIPNATNRKGALSIIQALDLSGLNMLIRLFLNEQVLIFWFFPPI
jgi:hypothetical protein